MTPELTWSIKDSLLGYIRSVDDGEVRAHEPAKESTEGFRFPADSDPTFDLSTGEGEAQFLGSVVLSAYFGSMRIEIRSPHISVHDDRGTLSVRMGGVLQPEQFVPVITLERIPAETGVTFRTRLTAEGRTLFGEQYSVGQEFSPLVVTDS